jgi:AraC family transcriptional regulator of adaptative response/methylated-DNA-[protein]-cysteine methyltransferase
MGSGIDLFERFAARVVAAPDVDVEAHAAALGVGVPRLSRTCRQLAGATARQLVVAYRMRVWRGDLQAEQDILDSALARFGALSTAYRHAPRALGMSPAAVRRGGAGTHIRYGLVDSPWGVLMIACTEAGACWVCNDGCPVRMMAEFERTYAAARRERIDAAVHEWLDGLLRALPALARLRRLPAEFLLAVLQHHLRLPEASRGRASRGADHGIRHATL